MLNEKIICAGFGGQGVMSMGQLMTYAGMIEDKEVSWLPSYGPEMRGGTANCSVILSDTLIGSPIITFDATTAIVMNLPSLEKFEQEIVAGGNLLINSSLISKEATRDDIEVHYVPANEIALEIGNPKAANMVMLGAYLGVSNLINKGSAEEALNKVFGKTKAQFIPGNIQAIERGMACVQG